jgi:hypothetical protein
MERKPFLTKVVMFNAIGQMFSFKTCSRQRTRTFPAELLEGLEALIFNLGRSAEGKIGGSRDMLGSIRSRGVGLRRSNGELPRAKRKVRYAYNPVRAIRPTLFGVKLKLSHDVLVMFDDRKILRRRWA